MTARKLKLPVGILITVSFLALYTGYAIWMTVSDRSWTFALAGGVAAIACVGTARSIRWSQFMVYLLCASFVVSWSYSVYEAARAGYFSAQSAKEMSFSLAPGSLLVCLAFFCSYAVFRHFRASPRAQPLH